MPHTLPPLPYDYDALEPYIDAQTMKLHHDVHHAGYVKGLNAAEEKIKEMRKSGDFSGLQPALQAQAFHRSGHVLHCLFWENMSPKSNVGQPSDELLKVVSEQFGDIETLKQEFCAAGSTVEGSGWVVLSTDENKKIIIHQYENHQNKSPAGLTPLLVCDVWEHAYYLHYQNKRAEYLENFWEIISWKNVSDRFAKI